MSILIKSMEMPKSCDACRLFNNPWCLAKSPKEWRTSYYCPPKGEKQSDCPLIELPPHGRLIDSDVLCKTLRSLAENEYTPEVFANWIENHIDTIIQAEEGKT